MPFRPERVVVHPDLEEAYAAWEELARRHQQPAQAVWKAVLYAIARCRQSGQWGEVIPRAAIPEYFRQRYGVSNLYCVDLAAFHRMFYTIANRAVVLLDVVDHPAYDKWFPGRRGG